MILKITKIFEKVDTMLKNFNDTDESLDLSRLQRSSRIKNIAQVPKRNLDYKTKSLHTNNKIDELIRFLEAKNFDNYVGNFVANGYDDLAYMVNI